MCIRDRSNFIGLNDSFCITELPFRIQSRTVSGQFSAHIMTSIAAGFVISFPYVLYQFWSFISPGLYSNEKKYARGFIFGTALSVLTRKPMIVARKAGKLPGNLISKSYSLEYGDNSLKC